VCKQQYWMTFCIHKYCITLIKGYTHTCVCTRALYYSVYTRALYHSKQRLCPHQGALADTQCQFISILTHAEHILTTLRRRRNLSHFIEHILTASCRRRNMSYFIEYRMSEYTGWQRCIGCLIFMGHIL